LAHRSIPLQSAYCGAKHAIIGLADSLRSELIHDRGKARIITVNLPAMNTPQFEWSRSRLPKHPQPAPPILQLPVIAENRPQILYGWCGPAMVVLNTAGSTAGVENAGLFFRQTRYLRDLRLERSGEAPFFCSAAEKKGGGRYMLCCAARLRLF
jgi:NAD(P)-dependent dehydrogenase (short-subunit alcohol dehydrogenase family)